MDFFKDVGKFLSYLTFVDIFFFIAIITLLILVVTLIYFIKINQDVIESPEDKGNNNGGNSKVNGLEKDILNILEDNNSIDNNIAHNSETPKSTKEEEEYNDEEGELIDLAGLTKKLEMVRNTKEDSVTAYEKDQEEKAIISYDELLKKKNKYAINYEKEEVLDDLVVKKVDLHDLVNKNEIDEIKEVRVISYDREEAFLKALKELNHLLN